MSLRKAVVEIGGICILSDNADEDMMELKTLLLLLFACHPNTEEDDVEYESRRKKIRKAAACRGLDLDSKTIEQIAVSGFSTSSLDLGCRSCNTAATWEHVRDLEHQRRVCDLLSDHSVDCPYRLLCTAPTSHPCRHQEPLSSLINHLRRELLTTKARVASECNYSDSFILIALCRQYLHHHEGFRDAGELVEELVELELKRRPWMAWDASVFLTSFTAADRERTVRSVGEDRGGRELLAQSRLAISVESSDAETDLHISNGDATRLDARNQEAVADGNISCSLMDERHQIICRWHCRACGKQDADQLVITVHRI